MSEIIIDYLTAKNGMKTVKINNYFLHSKFNPIDEAKRIIEKEYTPNFVHVIIGYGLGYLIKEMLQRINKDEPLIVIDPFWDKLNSENENYDENFVLIKEINKENIEKVITNSLENFNSKLKVICSPNYDKIIGEDYLVILESIKTAQRLQQVSENTTRQFAYQWQENYIHNLWHTYNNFSFETLKQRYNCPIVIISGGPSLKKQISLLKEIKNKVITIAAGSTIISLLSHEIEPDYIVTIDGGLPNYQHFKGLKDIKSHLIFGFSSHYKIQEEFNNPQFAILDAGDVEFNEYVNDIFKIEVPNIPGGASVANFAFSLAIYMTNGPIALIGQDLAYTNNVTHEENNKYFKKVDEKFIAERGLFEIDGYYGDKVLTDYAFLYMKKDFERLNSQFDHPSSIFNCTEGGVKIKGMNQLPFSEFCDSYVNSEEKIELYKPEYNPQLSKEDFKNKFKNEVKLYNLIIKEIQLGIVLIKRNKSNISFDKDVLKQLDKIDKLIKNNRQKMSMNHIFDPITMDVLRNYKPNAIETDREMYIRVYNQNLELYTRLLEAFNVCKQYILDTIEEIK